ncbi:hypothetical protein L218DRAFT_837741, partial [Marasmius fiardii PR-910]
MQRVDDTDSRLVYSPPDAWFLVETVKEWNFTSHVTWNAGAEMRFAFNGTQVAVFGTITNNQSTVPVSNLFILDDGKPVPWSVTVSNSKPLFATRMFSAEGLKDGLHTLAMQTTVDNSE